MSDTVHVYKDKAGEFRWKRTAANHEELDASTEGYRDESYTWVVAAKLNSDVPTENFVRDPDEAQESTS